MDGVPFDSLVRKYSVDGNAQFGGDLGWFEAETMVKPFSEAVRKQAQGAIFTIDFPERNWYFVVLKTHADRIKIRKCLLKVGLRD